MKSTELKAVLPIKGIIIGVLISLIAGALLLWIASILISSGRVGEDASKTLVLFIHAITVTLGAIATAIFTGKKSIAIMLTAGIILITELLVGLLFFEGAISGVIIRMIIAAVCTTVVCATCMKKTGKKGYKKLRTR